MCILVTFPTFQELFFNKMKYGGKLERNLAQSLHPCKKVQHFSNAITLAVFIIFNLLELCLICIHSIEYITNTTYLSSKLSLLFLWIFQTTRFSFSEVWRQWNFAFFLFQTVLTPKNTNTQTQIPRTSDNFSPAKTDFNHSVKTNTVHL